MNANNESEAPLILLETRRGRIINILAIESLAAPSESNPNQPYGCYMSSGIFHSLDEAEFDLIITRYSETISVRTWNSEKREVK